MVLAEKKIHLQNENLVKGIKKVPLTYILMYMKYTHIFLKDLNRLSLGC